LHLWHYEYNVSYWLPSTYQELATLTIEVHSSGDAGKDCNHKTMSEYTNTPPQHESFLDPTIADILQDFEDQLVYGDKAAFRALPDLEARVYDACWKLAENPQDQRKVARAVNLRSLYAVRSIDIKSKTVPADEDWPYNIPYHNDFWQQVDYGIKAYLLKYGYPVPGAAADAYETLNEHGIYVGGVLIADMNGRQVARQTLRDPAYEAPHHVTYVIKQSTPESV